MAVAGAWARRAAAPRRPSGFTITASIPSRSISPTCSMPAAMRAGSISAAVHRGHLAGVARVTDWRYVKFDDAMEEAMSSIRHLSRLHAPVTVAHGTLETPEFWRQGAAIATGAGGTSALAIWGSAAPLRLDLLL
jgi:hypothetical protein